MQAFAGRAGFVVAIKVRTWVRASPDNSATTAPATREIAVDTRTAAHVGMEWASQIGQMSHRARPHPGHPRATRVQRRSAALIPGG